MGNKFCTACGAPLSEGVRFCEYCGAPAESPALDSQPAGSPPSAAETTPPSDTTPQPGRRVPLPVLAGIAVVLVAVVALGLFILPALSSGTVPGIPGPVTPVPSFTPMPTTILTPQTTVTIPTPVPEPFPGALRLRQAMPFGSGEFASEGTVYRVWTNDTYHWHNDMDNKYYSQMPRAGNKYLIVFLNVYNNATTRVWPPTSNTVRVYYDGIWYSMDPVHFLPNQGSKSKEKPIEIQEIQYYSKMFGSEYVEDFGYSHGSPTAYLYPGKSNAIDGYIIYEVPSTLTPDKAYVRIAFNGNDTGIWKLG